MAFRLNNQYILEIIHDTRRFSDISISMESVDARFRRSSNQLNLDEARNRVNTDFRQWSR